MTGLKELSHVLVHVSYWGLIYVQSFIAFIKTHALPQTQVRTVLSGSLHGPLCDICMMIEQELCMQGEV